MVSVTLVVAKPRDRHTGLRVHPRLKNRMNGITFHDRLLGN
jgi:hypothetical protein